MALTSSITSSELRANGYIMYPGQDWTYWVHSSDLDAHTVDALKNPTFRASSRSKLIMRAAPRSKAEQQAVAHIQHVHRVAVAMDRQLGY